MYIEYCSRNSGGDWWLKDDDWKKLEAAGWIIVWESLENKYAEDGDYVYDEEGIPLLVPIGTGEREYRFLGALARTAYRKGLPLLEAIEEWERVTGQSCDAAGCSHCGQPHNFTEYDDVGKYVARGPVVIYEDEDEDGGWQEYTK